MQLQQLNWKKVAVVAVAAVAVVGIGFSLGEGPVEGSRGTVMLHHDKDACYLLFEMHFNNLESARSDMEFYSGESVCGLIRDTRTSNMEGRESVGETIDAFQQTPKESGM